MSKLLDYLNVLDKDASARDAHNADPAGAMTTFGLTEEEQDAFMSGDKNAVADLIGISADELPSIEVTQGV
ncbi:hypothetical protein RGU72_19770 [Undibacterium sp. 5I1]|uniref:hypothetical protein n=1 Tax=unclassified Undibacterium TaxID=2630295 RepID=UPI002AB4AF00|nr:MULTISPECIES: hypothetical protein [unclassified Undibacterium]MDY7540498.1 hypothetical protein [Undibacterium sp. 5I1]MEB0231643.1 hypothetical protein [Undibacterium sp. 10I3]MEB0259827.1 hypothetical protein [Undibacterium sp. 5I1]